MEHIKFSDGDTSSELFEYLNELFLVINNWILVEFLELAMKNSNCNHSKFSSANLKANHKVERSTAANSRQSIWVEQQNTVELDELHNGEVWCKVAKKNQSKASEIAVEYVRAWLSGWKEIELT